MRKWSLFVVGAVVGAAVASAVWFVGVRHVLMVAVQVPVLAFGEDGADPSYRIRGEQTLVFSELLGWQLGDSGTWTHDVPVPLTEPRRRVAFEARLGEGAPVRLAVDTAAEPNFMSWDGLATLGVPERVPTAASLFTLGIEGATGTSAARYFSVEALAFGPHVLRNQPFVLIPMRLDALDLPIAALGSHAFAGVTLDIDLGARELRINASAPPPPGATPWVRGAVLPRVPGRLGDVDVVVQIDTAATTTSLSPGLRERLALAVRDADERVTGTSGESTPVQRAGMPALEVAGARFEARDAHVLAIPTLARDVSDGAYVNLGMDALDGHRIVIDYPNRTVAIGPGGAPPPAEAGESPAGGDPP